MLLSQSVAAEEPEAQKEPNHCMVKGERYFPLVHIWQGEVRTKYCNTKEEGVSPPFVCSEIRPLFFSSFSSPLIFFKRSKPLLHYFFLSSPCVQTTLAAPPAFSPTEKKFEFHRFFFLFSSFVNAGKFLFLVFRTGVERWDG